MVEARFAVVTEDASVKYVPVKQCSNQTTEGNLICADWSQFDDKSNLVGTHR